jgi:hypothetical protein
VEVLTLMLMNFVGFSMSKFGRSSSKLLPQSGLYWAVRSSDSALTDQAALDLPACSVVSWLDRLLRAEIYLAGAFA